MYSSISRMTSVSVSHCDAPPPHLGNQTADQGRIDVVPFFFECLPQLSDIRWWGCPCSNLSVQLIPKMFDGRQVWRIRRPS